MRWSWRGDWSADGLHRMVLRTDGQRDPLVPGYGTDVVFAFDVQSGRHVCRHHAKRLLRCADVDGLPVAVEHQHHRPAQYVTHKIFAHDHPGSCDEVFVLCCFGLQTKLAASPGFAPRLPVSETGALLITPRGTGRSEWFCPLDFRV